MIEQINNLINSCSENIKSNVMFSRALEMQSLCYRLESAVYDEDPRNFNSKQNINASILRLSDSERSIRGDFSNSECFQVVSKVSDIGRYIAEGD